MLNLKKLGFIISIATFYLIIFCSCQDVTGITIVFNSNGGEFSNGNETYSMNVESEADFILPTNPTRNGYLFDGWYLDNEDFTDEFSATSLSEVDNITIYAKWLLDEEGNDNPGDITYTLTFETNGGSSISPITIEQGSSITIPSVPEKPDYIFDGWYIDNNIFAQSADTLFTAGITQDTTLYAKWTPQTPEEPQATEGLVFNLKGDNTYELIDYTGTDVDVYVPGTYLDTDVTSIAYNAFLDTTINSLTLGENITEIEYIGSDTQLESLHLPASLTTIDAGIISYQSLIEVTVSNDSLTYSSTDGVLFDKAVEELVMYPVAKSTSYTVPNGILRIGESCFRHNTYITSITLPDSLIEVEFGAFWLTQNLTTIVIPDNVTTIGNNAFLYSGIESVTLGDSVSVIGYNAFAGCNISSVIIPASVTEIQDDAFASCDNLTSVIIHATTPPIAGIDCFRNAYYGGYNEGLNIYVPASSITAYQTATNWSVYSDIIVGIN